MSNQQGTNNSSNGNQSNLINLNGLARFKKNLERDFFATAQVKIQNQDDTKINLVIELDCNFSLTESLFHLNNGNWGSYYISSANEATTSPFQVALFNLANDNDKLVDVLELTIKLKDTAIIISKIFEYSIPDQLGNILASISENFVHFTKALTEMPYEIFISIFEECHTSISPATQSTVKSKTDYFDFWGLYFESCPDALVYDLKTKTIIEEGDFFLLNQ